MKLTQLNIGFANWEALIWKESSVLQVIQWSYILACGLSWIAEARVERAECVSDLIVCYSPAPPQCLPLIGECPVFLRLPSAWQHPTVPLCTLAGPFALPQCGGSMHPYVCFVHNWQCLYVCGCAVSSRDILTSVHLLAGCSLHATTHPSSPGSYATPYWPHAHMGENHLSCCIFVFS